MGSCSASLGPHYAGVRLTGYRDVAPEVTESTFGDLVVPANGTRRRPRGRPVRHLAERIPSSHAGRSYPGRGIEDTFDGLALSRGTHYLIVERDNVSVTVRQPLGADTNLAIEPPSSWSSGQTVEATAIAPDGKIVGGIKGELRDGRFAFRYAGELNDHPVAAYRITVGPR